jgi:hypothetical protein
MDADTSDTDLATEDAPQPIERANTGIRILLTLLFALIWGVLETLLAVIVAFCLVWTLVTRQAPPQRLRHFSNWLVAYSYRIWRYLTYNEAEVPFPFSDLPSPIEPGSDPGGDEAREVRDLLARRRDADDERD